MANIGARLRAFRKLHGISVAKMAEDLQTTRQYIYRVERNLKVPSMKFTEKIARRIGMDLKLVPRRNGKKKRFA